MVYTFFKVETDGTFNSFKSKRKRTFDDLIMYLFYQSVP